MPSPPRFLQVEQLFGLGLRSRPECLKLLETCDWNLEVAGTQMLDERGSTGRRRYAARRQRPRSPPPPPEGGKDALTYVRAPTRGR